MNYGKGLKAIREGLDMDTIDFADLCGITPGTVFKYEENHEEITMRETMDICQTLKVPLEWFIGLSMEIKDVPPPFQFRFSQIVGKLTEATILMIREENLEGEEVDMVYMKKLLSEVNQILGKGE